MGAFVQQTGPLLGAAVSARVLGADGFGQFSFCLTGANALAGIGASALSLYATSAIAAKRRSGARAVEGAVGLATLGGWVAAVAASTLLFFASWLFGMRGPGAGIGPTAIGLSAAVCFLTVLQNVQAGMIIGLEQFSTAARAQLSRGLLLGVCTVAGATLAGLHGALSGLLLAGIVSLWQTQRLANAALAGAGVFLRSRWPDGAWEEIRVVVLPAFLGGVLVFPSAWIVQMLLLGGPDGLKQVGVFQATFMVRQVLVFLPTQLGQAGLPILSRLTGKEVHAARGQAGIMKLICLLSFVSSAGLAVLFGLFSRPIMGAFGPAFRGNQEALLVALVAGVLLATETPLASFLIAKRRLWVGFTLNAIWLGILVLFALTLKSRFGGAMAANLSYAAAYAVHGLTTIWVLGMQGSSFGQSTGRQDRWH